MSLYIEGSKGLACPALAQQGEPQKIQNKDAEVRLQVRSNYRRVYLGLGLLGSHENEAKKNHEKEETTEKYEERYDGNEYKDLTCR